MTARNSLATNATGGTGAMHGMDPTGMEADGAMANGLEEQIADYLLEMGQQFMSSYMPADGETDLDFPELPATGHTDSDSVKRYSSELAAALASVGAAADYKEVTSDDSAPSKAAAGD